MQSVNRVLFACAAKAKPIVQGKRRGIIRLRINRDARSSSLFHMQHQFANQGRPQAASAQIGSDGKPRKVCAKRASGRELVSDDA